MKDKILKLSLNVVSSFFALFSILFLISNIFFTTEVNTMRNIYSTSAICDYLLLIIVFILIFLLWKTLKNVDNRIIVLCMLTIFGIYGLFIISSLGNQLNVLDDQRAIVVLAQEFANNDFTNAGYKSYLNLYPHQSTIITILLVLCKVVGENLVFVIRLINLIFSLLSYYFIYRLVDNVFKKEEITKISLIIMFCMWHMINLSVITYTQSITYSLGIISAYFFTVYYEKKEVRYFYISLILALISSMIRMNNLIVVIAYIIFLLLDLISLKRVLPFIISCLLLLGSFGINNTLIKFYESKGETSYDNSLPAIVYIAVGLNYQYDTPGLHFDALNKYHYANDFVTEYTEKEAMWYINNSLNAFKDINVLTQFLTLKFFGTYTITDMGVFDTFTDVEYELNPLAETFLKGPLKYNINVFWNAIFSIVGVGLFLFTFGNKKITLVQMIPATIIVGGFLFHIIHETKAIYVVMYIMMLIPYASFGINRLFTYIENKIIK